MPRTKVAKEVLNRLTGKTPEDLVMENDIKLRKAQQHHVKLVTDAILQMARPYIERALSQMLYPARSWSPPHGPSSPPFPGTGLLPTIWPGPGLTGLPIPSPLPSGAIISDKSKSLLPKPVEKQPVEELGHVQELGKRSKNAARKREQPGN
jgi:hypothetical protein